MFPVYILALVLFLLTFSFHGGFTSFKSFPQLSPISHHDQCWPKDSNTQLSYRRAVLVQFRPYSCGSSP